MLSARTFVPATRSPAKAAVNHATVDILISGILSNQDKGEKDLVSSSFPQRLRVRSIVGAARSVMLAEALPQGRHGNEKTKRTSRPRIHSPKPRGEVLANLWVIPGVRSTSPLGFGSGLR